jgi:hypothetical protein
MDLINSDRDACYKLAAFVIICPDLSIADPGTLRLGDAEISATFPSLCRPDHIIADSGDLRLGDAEVSALLPCI